MTRKSRSVVVPSEQSDWRDATEILPDGVSLKPVIILAAQWLADQPEPVEKPIPRVIEKYALSALEACQAAKLAGRFRTVRRAFG